MTTMTTTEKQEETRTLNDFKPLRCILRFHKEGFFAGAIEGYVEYSFAMGWEPDHVQVHWTGKAYSNLGTTHQLNADKETEAEVVKLAKRNDDFLYVVVDPCDPACPVKVNLDAWFQAFTGKAHKFYKRNAPFTLPESP